jgi:hypothetical protein
LGSNAHQQSFHPMATAVSGRAMRTAALLVCANPTA